jgi:hypothetical protein
MQPGEAEDFKRFLFDHYPCLYAVWLSASKTGVRGIIKIPVCQSVAEFKQYFAAVENEFKQYGYKFDTSLKSPVLVCYQSYDPDILIRDNPETWDIKAEPPPLPPPQPIKQLNFDSDRQRQFIRETCLKGLKTSYEAITDVGHPNIRAIGLKAGGFAGAGIFTVDEMTGLLFQMIDGHPYLRQKADTYRKTAVWAIQEGVKRPIRPNITPSQRKATEADTDNFLSK